MADTDGVKPALIAGLATKVGELSEGIQQVGHSLVVSEENRKKDRRIYIVLIAVVLLFVGGLGYVVNDVHKVVESNNNLSRTVLDCIEPTGVCYKQGQARTGEAVANIAEASVLVNRCQFTAKTVDQYDQCVTLVLDGLSGGK